MTTSMWTNILRTQADCSFCVKNVRRPQPSPIFCEISTMTSGWLSLLVAAAPWHCHYTLLDLSDGQFLIAMRYRCFLCNSDAMSMVFGHSYHRNRYDYFCSTIGTDCFSMVFPISEPMFGDDFCGKPKNNVFYDMLRFETNCAYISALVLWG